MSGRMSAIATLGLFGPDGLVGKVGHIARLIWGAGVSFVLGRGKPAGRGGGRSRLGFLAVLAAILAAGPAVTPWAAQKRAVVLEINGAIGPATADYVSRELATVDPNDTGLVILRVDTPGGLDTSMREIIRAILASPVAVATYVAPSGARAASAGTYIAYACAIAAMAPGTNIGAASPVQMQALPFLPDLQPGSPGTGGGGKTGADGEKPSAGPNVQPTDTEGRKILNDALAYIHGLAELNGRNVDWAADAVRGAASLSATEALRLHVIDVIARDVPDLLRQIDGRTVQVGGRPQRLATAGLNVVIVTPDWRTQVLSVVTNPNVAYLLMLLGAYGLIFELANPGTVLPGTIGAISLLTALFAFNMLPVDFAGAGLVVLGIALMVAEAVIGTFGALGVGGIVAFVIGSIMMFHGNPSGFGVSISVVIGAAIFSGLFFLLVLAMLIRSHRRPVITGGEAMIGSDGETVSWYGTTGTVRVNGEIWQARCQDRLQPGTHIQVVGRDGLTVTVKKHR
jgi:membrane-bound serine protease (ClpP class)